MRRIQMNNIKKIREKMAAGQLCFGTHCSNTELDFYEMCGLLDYDYIWICNEHFGMTQPMIKNAIIATNAGGAAAFVRVPDHEMASVKPVLECGPDGIIFPMVNTAADARKCVENCLYPPRGKRGYGPLRAVDYGTQSLEDYLRTVDDSFLRMMQCETAESVSNLDEILEVDGVDVIICGPMDLSSSVGKMGQFYDPEVMGMIETIIRKCKEHNKPFGLSIGGNLELVKIFLKNGASFISMGTPLEYFRDMSREMVSTVRGLAESEAKA